MKAFLLLSLLLFISCNGQAYYEDHPEVEALASAGKAAIYKNSSSCPKTHGDNSLTDRLGPKKEYNTFCVKHLNLPSKVLGEVVQMEESELENESDYDSRVTKFYVFKQEKFTTKWGVTKKQIAELAQAFNIPSAQVKDPKFSTFIGKVNSVDQFAGLYVGDYYDDHSATHNYLVELLKDQLVLQVSFGDGVELYPGGGFGVTHYFFIIDGKLIYIKHSYWDA